LGRDRKIEERRALWSTLRDMAVLTWQDKKTVTMISTYHKDELHVAVNKVNKEETKPVVVYNYNVHMGGVDLKDQMLQPYLLE
jgi:hypothetical protein